MQGGVGTLRKPRVDRTCLHLSWTGQRAPAPLQACADERAGVVGVGEPAAVQGEALPGHRGAGLGES